MSDQEPKRKFSSPIDRRDFVGLVGLGLLGYGSWLIFQPAAFIAPGLILIYIAIFGVRN